MGIEEREFVELASQMEELEQKLFTHPLHKVLGSVPLSFFSLLHLAQFACFPINLNYDTTTVNWHSCKHANQHFYPPNSACCFQSQDVHQISSFQRKAEVNHEIQQLKSKMRDSQVLMS